MLIAFSPSIFIRFWKTRWVLAGAKKKKITPRLEDRRAESKKYLYKVSNNKEN